MSLEESKFHSREVTLEGRVFPTEELASLSLAVALEKKAVNPVLLDLRAQGAFMDFFGIVTAANGRQASAIAESVRVFLKHTFGLMPVSVDGLETQTWILMDYGAFFIHVFIEPTREMYKLEQLWSKGRVVPVDESAVAGLLTEVRSLVSAATSDAALQDA